MKIFDYEVPGWLLVAGGAALLMRRNSHASLLHRELVSNDFADKVALIANNLNMPADWIMHVIKIKSGFQPDAHTNVDGSKKTIILDYSGIEEGKTVSGGLLDYTASQARFLWKKKNVLHMSDFKALDALLAMNPIDQLDFVEAYLAPMKNTVKTIEELVSNL